MKILIINYFSAPMVNAHVYRWERLANCWSSKGHSVDYLTANHGDLFCANNNNYIRFAKINYAGNAGNAGNSKKNNLFKNKLKKLFRLLYWPDAYVKWLPAILIRTIKLTRDYDYIFSYYPCMPSHIAGYVAKALNPKSRWVMDYGDPFSTSDNMQPNNYYLFKKLNLWLEKKLFEKADEVVFYDEDNIRDYREKFPKNNFKLIPHLADIDSEYIYENKNKINSYNEKIKLAYFGSFHKNIREPKPLFDLVKKLNFLSEGNFELHIYGPENGFSLKKKEVENIFYHGIVEKSEIKKIICEYDILVNLENENCSMKPSKLVDYISTGMPILNLGGNGSIEFNNYAKHGYGLILSKNKISEIGINELEKIRSMKGYFASKDLVEIILKENSIKNIQNLYLAEDI